MKPNKTNGNMLGRAVFITSLNDLSLSFIIFMIWFVLTGVLYDTSYARCKRNSKFRDLVDIEVLLEQIEGFAYAYYDKNSGQLPNVKKSDIVDLSRDINDQFFTYLGEFLFQVLCSFSPCEVDKVKIHFPRLNCVLIKALKGTSTILTSIA